MMPGMLHKLSTYLWHQWLNGQGPFTLPLLASSCSSLQTLTLPVLLASLMVFLLGRDPVVTSGKQKPYVLIVRFPHGCGWVHAYLHSQHWQVHWSWALQLGWWKEEGTWGQLAPLRTSVLPLISLSGLGTLHNPKGAPLLQQMGCFNWGLSIMVKIRNDVCKDILGLYWAHSRWSIN